MAFEFDDIDDIAEHLGVTKRTVQNWRRYGPPELARRLMELRSGTHPDWAGIRIGNGELWLPDGTHQSAEQIQMGPYWIAQMITESKRCAEMERQLSEVKKVGQSANEASNLHSIALLKAGRRE